jgi:hypothetical protein
MLNTNGTITKANNVVDEKPRQEAAREDHRRQQLVRLQPAQYRLGVPLEDAHQVQVPDDQHHRKQQHDGREVDKVQRLPRTHRAKRHHPHRANDRRARAVDLQPGEFPQGEYQVAGQKDDVCRQDAGVESAAGESADIWPAQHNKPHKKPLFLPKNIPGPGRNLLSSPHH